MIFLDIQEFVCILFYKYKPYVRNYIFEYFSHKKQRNLKQNY